MNIKCIFLVIVFLHIILLRSYSQQKQDTTILHVIETSDGNEYVGEIIKTDYDRITLLTEKGREIKIFTKYIKQIREVSISNLNKNDFWFDNPQATKYFISGNGYGLKKGEGYYQNSWIILNQVAIGITNNFSVTAGTVPLFMLGEGPLPIWFSPKLSVPLVKNKLNIGVSGLGAIVVGETESSIGVLFGTATIGSKNKNISIGMGYGASGGETTPGPTVSISGMFRTGPTSFLLTENYYIGFTGEKAGILSIGGRKLIKEVSIDFGGFIPFPLPDKFVVIPWLGLMVPFG